MIACRFASLLLIGLPIAAVALPTLDFTPPPFLVGPTISRSATGNTYLYVGNGDFRDLELRLTTVEIPRELSKTDPTPCVEAFIDELRRSFPTMFHARTEYPLHIGPLVADQWRWSASRREMRLTGVVSCGVDGGRYIVASFQDEIRDAPQSFPAIREALAELALP